MDLAYAEYLKPKEQPIENPKKRFREQNEKLKVQQEKYELKIKEITENLNRKIKDAQKYRDDWVTYLKAKEIATEKAKKERELKAENKRIQDEKDAKIAQENAEEEQKNREAEWKAMPTNLKYKQWKVKYEKALSLSQANVNKCEAIIKKHTFKNAFGQKKYDSSDFSQSEKKVFNQNLDLLKKQSDEIGSLESEEKYYYYWNETVSIQKSTWSYRLSSYYNSKSKVY